MHQTFNLVVGRHQRVRVQPGRVDNAQAQLTFGQACADAGHRAIVFGDLNDPASEIAQRVRAVTTTQLRADLRTDNGVRYQGI